MLNYFASLPRHFRIGLQLAAVVAVLFTGLMVYALRTAPRMSRESQRTLDAFYARCQRHDYGAAYAMLAPELRDTISPIEMASGFAQFEYSNGKIEKWAPAAGGSINFGGRVCLFPPFVDYTHRLIGTRPKPIGEATVVYIRLVPRDGKWQVQRLSFMR